MTIVRFLSGVAIVVVGLWAFALSVYVLAPSPIPTTRPPTTQENAVVTAGLDVRRWLKDVGAQFSEVTVHGEHPEYFIRGKVQRAEYREDQWIAPKLFSLKITFSRDGRTYKIDPFNFDGHRIDSKQLQRQEDKAGDNALTDC